GGRVELVGERHRHRRALVHRPALRQRRRGGDVGDGDGGGVLGEPTVPVRDAPLDREGGGAVGQERRGDGGGRRAAGGDLEGAVVIEGGAVGEPGGGVGGRRGEGVREGDGAGAGLGDGPAVAEGRRRCHVDDVHDGGVVGEAAVLVGNAAVDREAGRAVRGQGGLHGGRGEGAVEDVAGVGEVVVVVEVVAEGEADAPVRQGRVGRV